MITDLAISSYQSLRDLRVKLGKFTVITGPTSSGKSGVIRAMRLAAFNAPGTSYISTGAGTCKVMLNDADAGVAVQITRTASRGGDAYDLIAGGEKGHYTKLAGQVPDDVKRAMQLTQLNFASQFDAPFLLTEPGGDVAKRLGKLTNVTMILAAAQEAGRRRKRIDAELKATRDSVDDLAAQAVRFRGLGERRAAMDRAEAALAEALLTDSRVRRLNGLLAQHAGAQARVDAIVVPPAPDVTAVAAAWDRWLALSNLIQRYRQAEANTALAHRTVDQAHHAQDEAEARLHESLVAAGTCPVCGQSIPSA